MAKKCLVEKDLVVKVAGKLTKSFTGEEFRSVTATLECGLRVTIRDTDPEFHRFAKYLKKGDMLSFEYTGERPWSFTAEAREGQETGRTFEGVDVISWKDMHAEAGNWTEEVDSDFANRSEATFTERQATTARPTAAALAAAPAASGCCCFRHRGVIPKDKETGFERAQFFY
jgi:hypothetical protein